MLTPLPAVAKAVMQELVRGLLPILGARLIGVYVGGSVAMGDFAEATSDLDFLVVTDGFLSMEDEIAIRQLHAELLGRHGFAARLEGDYAPLETLIPEGTTVPVPGCERGVFLARVGEVMLSAENIYNVREHGIPLWGPPPHQILPAVSAEQVRNAIRRMLREGPGAPETAEEAAAELLNLTRSLLSLQEGRPVTKSQGASWALQHLPPTFRPLIELALAVRSGRAIPGCAGQIRDGLKRLYTSWPDWDPAAESIRYQKAE
jgi:hypothetical protein